MTKTNLRIPGPTPCREEVLAACSRPMMNYRGPEMAELSSRIVDKFRRFLGTERDVVLLTSSGTGALEAAVANFVSAGDRVVGVDAGVFGKRFCSVAETYGAALEKVDVEWGRPLRPEVLRQTLRATPDCRAVLLTHNETSTGVAHPIAELCAVVREESDALLMVDGVSSLGAMPLDLDGAGVDVAITGSQKAWGVPPGMSVLFLSQRAWDACDDSTSPRFYFDLRRYRDAQERGSFPFTPALPIVYAFDVALDFLLAETSERVFARHARVAEHARGRLVEGGLSLFAEPAAASATVTSIRVPDGVDEPALIERLRERHHTVLARGQERLRGSIVRLGHLGWVREEDVDPAIDALLEAVASPDVHTR